MKIKYVGGRAHYEVSFNRKPYYFSKENNRTLEIKEQEIVNYIFSLPNRAEFEVVIEPESPTAPVETLGISDDDVPTLEEFIAKNKSEEVTAADLGLTVHKSKHKHKKGRK